MGMPRVNLLLIGVDGTVWNVLGTPVGSSRADRHLVSRSAVRPSASGRIGTLILHDIGALTPDEQRHLLKWLEQAAGRTQIISTASAPLPPAVKAGTFPENLYSPIEHRLRRSHRVKQIREPDSSDQALE